jgi:hypothetical protein
MATNWEELDKEMGGDFKNYAEDGKYDVKCDSIEVKEVGTNGSIIMKFGFEDTDVQYPTADHWLSFKNENFRKYHSRNLMMVLGASKENAEKAVDVCEGKGSKENIVKAYEQTFGKLVAKKPTVKIEVYTEAGNNGKDYARAEFADRSVAMPHGEDNKASADAQSENSDPLAGAEQVDLDIPF